MKKCPCCGNKYRDTDFYCLRDNYPLVQCQESELMEQDKLNDKVNKEKYEHPNAYGNFTKVIDIHKCPICQSTNIHKISISNKIGSVVALGLFSTGYISKTFKCESCGAKF